MKKLYLVLTIFRKQLLLNVLICLELCLMFFIFSVTLNRNDYIHRNESVLHQSNLEDSINFTGNSGDIYVNGKYEKTRTVKNDIIKMAKDSQIVEGVSQFEKTYLKIGNSEDLLPILLYDAVTVDKLKIPLTQGTWLPTQHVSDTIPVVAISNRGQQYTVGQQLTGMINGELKTLEVVGTTDVALADLFLPDGERGHIGDISKLFSSLIQGQTLFMAQSIETIQVEPNILSENMMLYIKKGTSPERILTLKKQLSNYGQASIVSEMIVESYRVVGEKNRKDMAIFLVLCASVFVGVLSISILNLHKQLRQFSIWLMNGYTLKDIGLVYITYMGLIGVVSVLLYSVLMHISYTLDGRGHYYFYFVRWQHVLLSTTIVAGITLMVTGITLKIVSKKGVFEYYYD